MKNIYISLILLVCAGSLNRVQAQLNSVELIAAGGLTTLHPSITAAYAAIPPSPTVSYTIELLPPYDGTDPSEVFPIQLTDKAITPGGAITITIRPDITNPGETILRPTPAAPPLIQFNGGDNVILDGRPGGISGATSTYLTVSQPFTTNAALPAGTFFRTIELLNAANNNTVQFTNVLMAPATSITGAQGVVVAGTTSTGNNNNSILNNIITGGTRGVQDFGQSAVLPNNATIIRDNVVSNFAAIGIFAGSNQTNISVIANTVTLNAAVALVGAAGAAISITGIQQQATSAASTGNITDNIINLAPLSGNISLLSGIVQTAANPGNSTENILRNKITGITGVPATLTVRGIASFNNTTGVTTSLVNITDNKIENLTDVASTGVAANVTAQGIGVFGAATVNVLRDTVNNLSSVTNVQGINIGTITGQTQAQTVTVSANIFSNLSATGAGNIRGMSLFPFAGSTLNINNNFVAITQPNSGAAFIAGILAGASAPAPSPYTSNIFFNSIRIGGTNTTAPLAFTGYGIFKGNAGTSVYNQRNNISIMERDGGTAFNLSAPATGLSMDFNTYFATGATNSFAASTPTADYTNAQLAAYKADAAITPNEVNTNFTAVSFVSTTDLHLAPPSTTDPALNGQAVAGITTDIDGQARIVPIRGADEPQAAVPVNLLSFTGTAKGSINQLFWSTATESNNAGFELQRSADGRNFTKLSFIATRATDGTSASTLDYSFDDVKPFAFNSYYRLKQIDRDGRFTYSSVVNIRGKGAVTMEISNVYPNPVTDKFNLVVASQVSSDVAITITDMNGKALMQRSYTVIAGDNILPLNAASFSSGTYLIKAVNKTTGESAVTKFVK